MSWADCSDLSQNPLAGIEVMESGRRGNVKRRYLNRQNPLAGIEVMESLIHAASNRVQAESESPGGD